jgi:hypothetical protein
MLSNSEFSSVVIREMRKAKLAALQTPSLKLQKLRIPSKTVRSGARVRTAATFHSRRHPSVNLSVDRLAAQSTKGFIAVHSSRQLSPTECGLVYAAVIPVTVVHNSPVEHTNLKPSSGHSETAVWSQAAHRRLSGRLCGMVDGITLSVRLYNKCTPERQLQDKPPILIQLRAISTNSLISYWCLASVTWRLNVRPRYWWSSRQHLILLELRSVHCVVSLSLSRFRSAAVWGCG